MTKDHRPKKKKKKKRHYKILRNKEKDSIISSSSWSMVAFVSVLNVSLTVNYGNIGPDGFSAYVSLSWFHGGFAAPSIQSSSFWWWGGGGRLMDGRHIS